MRIARLFLALGLASLTAGCPNPNTPAAMPAGSGIGPSPNAGGLSGLVREANEAEKQVAENLNTPLTLSFPVRLGILFFSYAPALKPEDQQLVLNDVKGKLLATGLVKSTVLIPSSLSKPNDSLETIRKLASRFGVDTLLVVSGMQHFDVVGGAPGFFDSFTNKASYEASTELTAVGMDVLSGRFLPPFETAGKAGPKVLNPEDGDFRTQAYALQKEAETTALTTLEGKFVDALKLVQAQPAPQPTTSPQASPSPEPSAEPTATPDAEATEEAAATTTP